MTKLKITEEDGLHKEWYEEASKQTLETLPAFLNKLVSEYDHDYGTICHATAASAVGAAWAIGNDPNHGITNHQAGGIMWLFIQNWMGIDSPLRLMNFKDMLYPQYENKFQKTISQETFDYLQTKAKELLAEENHYTKPNVELHWRSIINGEVPFGYTLEPKEENEKKI